MNTPLGTIDTTIVKYVYFEDGSTKRIIPEIKEVDESCLGLFEIISDRGLHDSMVGIHKQ